MCNCLISIGPNALLSLPHKPLLNVRLGLYHSSSPRLAILNGAPLRTFIILNGLTFFVDRHLIHQTVVGIICFKFTLDSVHLCVILSLIYQILVGVNILIGSYSVIFVLVLYRLIPLIQIV